MADMTMRTNVQLQHNKQSRYEKKKGEQKRKIKAVLFARTLQSPLAMALVNPLIT